MIDGYRSTHTLELPAILAHLAEHASFSAGRERALALTPSSVQGEVVHRQQETTEARHLLDIKPDMRLGGVHDLRPLVDAAGRGARLLPHDLLNIRDTLDSTRRLKRSLLNLNDPLPHIADIAQRFDHCPELLSEIERCISDAGQVEDHASQTLGRLRGELKVAYDRLLDRLNRILSNPKHARALQEGYITQRDGRYVIPVKAEFKGRIPGLVHDQSASGATLFIEPMATVDLNNRWREIQLAEQHEVERILTMLSAIVAEQGASVRATVEALADLDLALAKAKYSYALRGIMPEIVPFTPRWQRARRERGDSTRRDVDNPSLSRGDRMLHPGSVLELRQARHPLLDPRTVVPIDFNLEGDVYAVVITGPNTGGKTVAIKTVGLLTLMAQCGLHLPAEEGSRLTVFEQVCADIGDEQSIEQSLSTFSSHMTHIIEMLEDADDRSLILLDELGAGTDPLEGAALAQALLIELLERHITVLATTHYAEIKVFAEQQPGIVNASVEFNAQTLAPTYHLTVGLPGQSNAFAIATRLGLPAYIVDRARDLVSDDHLEAENFLVQIKQTQAETTQARKEAQQANLTAQKAADELRERLANIEQERATVLNEARALAAQELEAVRKELRALRRQIAVMGGAKFQDGMAGGTLSDAESAIDSLADRLTSAEQARATPAEIDVPGTERKTIEVGDTVWVPALDATGEVLTLEGQAAEVQMGAFRVRTRRAPLQLRHKGPAPTTAEPERHVSSSAVPVIHTELHLRGLRVDEAMPRLEKYIDDACRAQAPFVRIVHGKGTGTLRKVVHEYLRDHPLVSSFRVGEPGEGDTGVTVVKFVGS